MMNSDLFSPTLAAAQARMAAVSPSEYARSRNAIEGGVSRLSPYITHGLVSLPQVLASVAARHPVDVQHKLVYELGWREYFRHVWLQRGQAILQSLHEGVLPEQAYAPQVPDDIRQARTGVPVIDQSVRTLYATGYLHNHARMWLASYVVHLRKVHWRAGADWLLGHLLDGDLASNHLSWQWVAGTGSHKPYVFNADNVARYAPKAWHSTGSVVDTSYESLDAMARSPRPVRVQSAGSGVDEPVVSSAPPPSAALQAADVAGKPVWLVHPWALGEPPADLPEGAVCIGWWPAEHHAAWPWSAARWSFVSTRMAELAPLCGHGQKQQLAQLLAAARSVQTWANPHVSALLPPQVVQRAPPQLFADVRQPCHSFSSWWNRSTKGIQQLADLPGLSGQ